MRLAEATLCALLRTGAATCSALFYAVVLALVAVVVLNLVRLARGNALLRRWREQQGYRIRRVEQRFFTRGPFREMAPLPGMRFGGRLYRVEAEDRAGASRVAWVRMLVTAPWEPMHWELRMDESPEATPRGLGRPAFSAIVLTVMAGILTLAYTVARSSGLIGPIG